MNLETFSHTPAAGWSVPSFPMRADASSRDATLVIVFAGARYLEERKAIDELAAAYAGAAILGCSTAGEINGSTIRDDSLSVAVLQLEKSVLRRALCQIEDDEDSFAAGRSLAKELYAPSLRGIFLLAGGIGVNGSELTRGLTSVLPSEIPVTGGLAGDGDRFEHTWVLDGAKAKTDTIVAVGFYGPHMRLGHGAIGGWETFGPQRMVTRSQSTVLYELDGQPALSLYKRYLGDRAEELPGSALLFPLLVKLPDQREAVRTIVAVDELDESLRFAGNIPEGSLARLMHANFKCLVGGASDAAGLAHLPSSVTSATLSIAISGVGRRMALGEWTEDETEVTLASLSGNVQQVGFYSYGELAPYGSGSCQLHNQTMSVTTIAEL